MQDAASAMPGKVMLAAFRGSRGARSTMAGAPLWARAADGGGGARHSTFALSFVIFMAVIFGLRAWRQIARLSARGLSHAAGL
ncbi:MAG: hypothetical protein U5N55_00580 [Cypionkella sp.]|nr:hypothetical protein [Cypionkella sp.]